MTKQRRKRKSRVASEADILSAIPLVYSLDELQQKLGLKYIGKNSRAYKVILNNNVDISHFKEAEVKIRDVSTAKKYLLNKRGHQCESCFLIEWGGDLIELDIHHISGDSNDHSEENTQLLCKNCHALTDNYAGKGNKTKRYKFQVTKEELIKQMEEMSITALAEFHGVTRAAIRKCALKLGLSYKTVNGRCILSESIVGWDDNLLYVTDEARPVRFLQGNENLAN